MRDLWTILSEHCSWGIFTQRHQRVNKLDGIVAELAVHKEAAMLQGAIQGP